MLVVLELIYLISGHVLLNVLATQSRLNRSPEPLEVRWTHGYTLFPTRPRLFTGGPSTT
jgi:hypothetical protein